MVRARAGPIGVLQLVPQQGWVVSTKLSSALTARCVISLAKRSGQEARDRGVLGTILNRSIVARIHRSEKGIWWTVANKTVRHIYIQDLVRQLVS